MKRLQIITILLLHASALIAQDRQINIRKYTIEDGLVNNDILNIHQDSRGFIWLCTRGGLSRYDGSRFTNFTPGNGLVIDMINDIYEIAPQEFIVAQNMAGPVLLKNDRILPLPQGKNVTVNKFYPLKKDRLIVATDYQGVMEWTAQGIKPLQKDANTSVSRIAFVSDSTWVLVDLNLYAVLFSPTGQTKSPYAPLLATTVFTDSKQRTWLGTALGLKLINPAVKNGQPISLLPLPPEFDLPILRDSYTIDILEDSQGNIWFGTYNGLVKVNKNGTSIAFTQQNGLPASMINCIIEDRQQNIWVGTPLGLVKLQPENASNTYVLNLGLPHAGDLVVSPLSKDKLRLFDGKKISDLDLSTGNQVESIPVQGKGYTASMLSGNEILVKNGNTAMVFRAGRDEPEMVHWPDTVFDAIIKTGPDRFLMAKKLSIFSVVKGRCTEKVKTHIAGPVSAFVSAEKNTVWAATYYTGLIKLKISGEDDSLQVEIVDTVAHRLPDQNIRCLFADREKELWVGTRYKGAIRLLELSNGQYQMQQFGTAQGLSSDFIFSFNRDRSGNIWVGTAQGVDKLVPEGNSYRVFNFGRVNKIFTKVYDIDFLDSNYLLVNGYPSLFYARDMRQDQLPPLPVYITKIAGAPSDTNTLTFTRFAQLPYNKAQIYFEFSSPQFINEDYAKYSYRLLGSNDTVWTNASNSRSVSFASLSAGNYTFQVRTLGFNGAWSKPAVYNFIVGAPFYQKAWFIALIVLACGLLIYVLYRYRVQQLIRLQKVRNRIASDLHDEIGSNLTNISILSNLSQNNLLQPQKAGDFLQRISEEVSSSSQALDDIIWSVNTSHDTLEETVARMRRYAAELFDAANISYDLYLDPAFESKRLSMEQRRDIYLLYKEAVNNISKHASAGHVVIQIAIEHNQLLMSIKDDGRGFDITRQTDRHGLKGMQQRVKKWKGKITIESGKGSGTFIQTHIPISK